MAKKKEDGQQELGVETSGDQAQEAAAAQDAPAPAPAPTSAIVQVVGALHEREWPVGRAKIDGSHKVVFTREPVELGLKEFLPGQLEKLQSDPYLQVTLK